MTGLQSQSLERIMSDAILQSLPFGIVIVDDGDTIHYLNQVSKKSFGYQGHELVGKHISHVVTGIGRMTTISQKKVVIKHKDGARFNQFLSVAPYMSGKQRLFICAFQNSPDNKPSHFLNSSKTSNVLASHDRILSVFKEAAIGMMLVDMNGRPVETNPALQSMLMYSAEELQKMTFSSFTYTADVQAGMGLYTELVAGQRDSYQFEKRYVRKDGQLVYGRVTVSMIRDDYDHPLYALSIIEDITETKKVTDSLLESEEKYRTLMNEAGEMILVANLEGRIVDSNKQAEELLGYDKAQLHQASFFDILSGAEVDEYFHAALHSRYLKPATLRDWYAKRKNDVVLPVELTLSVVEYSEQRFVLTTVRDISARKKVEMELTRAHEGLELRVASRTSALEKANKKLIELAAFRKQTEQALRASQQRFKAVVNNTPIILFALDEHGKFTLIEGKGLASIGLEPGEVVGQSVFSLYGHIEQLESNFKRAMTGESFTTSLRIDSAVFELCCSPIRDENHQISGVIGVMTDITERMQAEDKIRLSERRLSTILENMQDTYYRTDNMGNFVLISPSVHKLLGHNEFELTGKSFSDLFVDPEGYQKFLKELENNDGSINNYELALNRKDGSIVWVSSNGQYCFDDDGEMIGIEGTTRDITERKQAEQHLRYLANYDALTKLPNRTLFRDRLEHAMAYSRRYNHLVVLMFLDLDRFKSINDSLGHLVGDQLLQAVSERLRSCAREGDTVARLGGDEFTIVMEGIVDVADADVAVKKVLNAMSKSFVLEGHDIYVTTSIGVTVYPTDSDDIESLIRNADTAMYRAKRAGRNNYQFYTEDMNTRAIESLLLQNNLRNALDKEEFLLYYQPQVDMTSGDMIGMEALIRWKHPELGLLSPVQFIPIAEETGLIIPIGEWVLRKVCMQVREWQDNNLSTLRVSVNLSACQFKQRDLVESISSIIKETGANPHSIELEITEGVLVDDEEAAIDILKQLSALGLHISIDDFGTGYSSMNYLKRFPLNTLKIDKTFINDIATDPENAAITEAIIALGHSLKLKVIAEGVETQEQLSFLSPRGCDEVQGFYFSEPLPAPEVIDWMISRQGPMSKTLQ